MYTSYTYGTYQILRNYDSLKNLRRNQKQKESTPNLTLKKTVKPIFVPKANGESSNKDENLKMINDHTTYGLSTKDDYM